MPWRAQLADPKHPIWGLAERLIQLLIVVVILRANATDFDWTEKKSILEIATLAGALSGARYLLRRGDDSDGKGEAEQ